MGRQNQSKPAEIKPAEILLYNNRKLNHRKETVQIKPLMPEASTHQVVGYLIGSGHEKIWPNQVASLSGMTVANARDSMITMVSQGLLDLEYVEIIDGEETHSTIHPEPLKSASEDNIFLRFIATDMAKELCSVAV